MSHDLNDSARPRDTTEGESPRGLKPAALQRCEITHGHPESTAGVWLADAPEPVHGNGNGPATARCLSGSSPAGEKLWVRAVLWLGNVHRRMLGVYFGVAGPRTTYGIMSILARLLYRLLDPIRARSEAQCRAALGDRVAPEDVPRIAERSFIHRVWNLADLMLADRLLHPNTYHRYGGTIAEPHLGGLLDAQRRKQPAILLTAYYGSFDLLPIFLGYNGIQAGVVYRPSENAAFDDYRRRIRGRSGCELIRVDRAAGRLAAILEAGGSVAIVADHHADRRGIPVTFLGLPTMAMRSVGLLAWRYNADVAVAGIRRIGSAFRFELIVADTLYHSEWERADDPVAYVTDHYLRALENLVLGDPTQYLWGYARWGEGFLRQLLARDEPGQSTA